MSRFSRPLDKHARQRIADLARILCEAEQELRDLTGDEIDAVIRPDGASLLLHDAQRRLRESEARYKAIIDALPAEIAYVNGRGEISSVNESWQRLAERWAPELSDHGVGMPFGEVYSVLYPGDHTSHFFGRVNAVLKGSIRAYNEEYPCERQGNQRWYRGTAIPVSDDEAGCVVMHVDITERKQRETERQLLVHELGERIKELGTLHRVTDLFRREDLNCSKLLESAVAIIPEGFTHPELTGAAITYDGRTYRSAGFPATGSELNAAMTINGVDRGEIRVRYRPEGSTPNEDPFLKEEHELIGSLADLLQAHLKRIEAEASLEESERRFRLLAESMPLIVWTATPEGRVDYASPALYDYTGVSPGADPGERWLDMLHPDDRERCIDVWNEAVTTKGHYEIEYRIWHAAEAIHRWQKVRAVPARDVKGRVTKWFGTATDIHDSKLMEQDSRSLAARLTATLESINDGFFSLDREFRFTYLNSTACDMLDASPDYLVGRALDEGLSTELGKLLRPVLEDAVSSEKPAGFEGRIRASQRWLAGRVYPFGEGVTVYMRDIGEQRQLEEQVLRNQRMESIGTLAGGIAHDLNNLLTPVLMGLEFLRESSSDTSVVPVVRQIEESARRGAGLVRQVLTFSRGTSGERKVLSVIDLIRDVEALVKTTFPKAITCHVRVPDDLYLIGDPTQINQVLVNLAVNARDAMPAGGSLAFMARRHTVDAQEVRHFAGAEEGVYVLIEVVDTGTGMPSEVVDRIFEPFFTTKPQGEGTGLGLSTSMGIVRSHGGFVRVYSEPGGGTVFKVFLPAAGNVISSANPEQGNELPRGAGETVLLVDDDRNVREMTLRTLESFGYRVLTAEEGGQALDLVRDHHSTIDLLLTDIMMPGMDGPALIRTLREANPDLPIIAASGLPSNETLTENLPGGPLHFLPKPYSTEVLLKLMRVALRKRRKES